MEQQEIERRQPAQTDETHRRLIEIAKSVDDVWGNAPLSGAGDATMVVVCIAMLRQLPPSDWRAAAEKVRDGEPERPIPGKPAGSTA